MEPAGIQRRAPWSTLPFSQGPPQLTLKLLGCFSLQSPAPASSLVGGWKLGEGRRRGEPGSNGLSGKGRCVPELSPPCRILRGQVIFRERASRKMGEGEKPQDVPLHVAMATRKLLALALQPFFCFGSSRFSRLTAQTQDVVK